MQSTSKLPCFFPGGETSLYSPLVLAPYKIQPSLQVTPGKNRCNFPFSKTQAQTRRLHHIAGDSYMGILKTGLQFLLLVFILALLPHAPPHPTHPPHPPHPKPQLGRRPHPTPPPQLGRAFPSSPPCGAKLTTNRRFWRSACFQNPLLASACILVGLGGLSLHFRKLGKCIDFCPV